MLKTKIRNYLCLLLCMLFAFAAIVCFSACSDDGFEIVQSITYVTGGETKTETSKATLLFDDFITTTESAYYASDVKHHFDDYLLDDRELSRSEKTIDNYYGLTEDDIGQKIGCRTYRYSGNNVIYDYHTLTFYGWGYDYIRVKVIDNTTLVIRDYITSTPTDSVYNVTSYQITYFDED